MAYENSRVRRCKMSKAMKYGEINAFIKKILPNEKIKVSWISDTIASKIYYRFNIRLNIAVNRKNTLYINKKFWNSLRSIHTQKYLLLHEMGHVYFKDKEYSPWKTELVAQLWALKQAKKFKMARVGQEIFEQLCKWDCGENWFNKHDRRYVIASRMAFKYGIENLMKKYHLKAA